MIFFDAHVHIHEIFTIDGMLDSARRNFARHAPLPYAGPSATYFLLLSEAKSTDFFSILRNKADAFRPAPGGWRFFTTDESETLRASHEQWPDGRFFILAGRQVVTEERIEVLALATREKLTDGLTLDETVEAVRRRGGLAVLPWGVGKWLGHRGKILETYIGKGTPEGLFIGDNGGRPVFWPEPRLFQTAEARGIRLLPGSDPLPLPAEEARVGSYGGFMQGEVSSDHPAADLRRLLAERTYPIVPFGGRMGIGRFLQTQVALRRLSPHRQ